jgi:hypothetical protein
VVRIFCLLVPANDSESLYSPGRFFAALEIKLLLAHVLVNYDVKLADSRGEPADWWFGAQPMLDPTVKVMFRKRM